MSGTLIYLAESAEAQPKIFFDPSEDVNEALLNLLANEPYTLISTDWEVTCTSKVRATNGTLYLVEFFYVDEFTAVLR